LPATPGKNPEFLSKKLFLSGFRLVLCHIFEIKLVEMGEPAVPAPDDKVPAADRQVVGTGTLAVPAFGCLDKFPEIVTADFDKLSFFADVLDPGYENPGSPAVVAGHLRLERHRRDDLIGDYFTVITVRPVPREDETSAHGR
jgi:hypothetical protein